MHVLPDLVNKFKVLGFRVLLTPTPLSKPHIRHDTEHYDFVAFSSRRPVRLRN